MRNTIGTHMTVTLFGESHGTEIGAVLDGVAPGVVIHEEHIRHALTMRRPQGAISTARQEQDEFRIVSGVKDGVTTGAPLTLIIPNADTRSSDYASTAALARPGHADYAAHVKYHGYEDGRGGGHFSGRLTAPLVALGAIASDMLAAQGIQIGTHIDSLFGIFDRPFDCLEEDISLLKNKLFPVLDASAEIAMKAAILAAKEAGDSVGGTLECVVTGIPAGLGEPWFDTTEGLLAHALFSIPAVKGVEFGAGFEFATMRGSEANDPWRATKTGVHSTTNHNGGINGGITNGMPLRIRVAVKPTPTIAKEQQTIHMDTLEDATIAAKGRHDPAIVHRARAVVDAMVALTLCDLLSTRNGTDSLQSKK